MAITLNAADGHNFYIDSNIFYAHGISRFVLHDQRATDNKLSSTEFLEKMAASGINSLRMVIPGEFERGVEPELGVYNPAFLKPIDEVFETAEKLGIQIILCLFDSTSFYASWAPDEYWKYGIYSTKFSGPKEVFSNVELRQLMKNRAAFLVNHFSRYSNIFAWEVMNEMNKIGDLFGNKSEEVTMEWYNDIAASIKELDPTRLVTGSLYGDEVWESLNRCNNNDFIQIHTYEEELDPARIREIITKYCIDNKKYNKPIIISEFASKKSNPLRNRFVREGLLAAQKQGCSAWLYASVWDSDAENGMGHGDMNEELFEVYRSSH